MAHQEVPPPKTVEEKMDIVIHHLERIDKRDRIRMWGALFHSLFAIIPLLFFIWSAWYLYEYGDDLMRSIASQAARNAAEASGQNYEDALQQVRDFFGPQQ